MFPPDQHERLISQSMVGTLFAGFRHAAIVTNSEHRIVWVNAAFEKLYGYRASAVLGLPATLLHDPSLPVDSLKPVARQLLEERRPWCGTYRNQHANGKAFNAYYFAVPLDHFPHLPVNGVFCVSCLEADAEGLRDEVLGHVINRCVGLAVTNASEGGNAARSTLSRKGQRQKEVHRLSLLGYSSKEIAGLMGISPSTVNVVRWKLGRAATAKKPRAKLKS